MPAPHDSARFTAALAAFDAANAADPHRETADGIEHPREVLYARRLSDWVERLRPAAPEALRLAARCQHLCRWEIPRTSYPDDRAGYLRWRRDLQQFHARKSAEILARLGYDDATIARVRSLNLKENLATDADCQTLEDALCLVFLQYQLAELAARTDDDKLVNALRKSWNKMSPRGREAALGLSYGARERALLERALAAP